MDRIPLFPLDAVVFPGQPFGLRMFEERYVMMAEEVIHEGVPIGLALRRPGQAERMELDPEDVGTELVLQSHHRDGDHMILDMVGGRRFRVREVLSELPYQEALVEWLDEPEGDEADDSARRLFERLSDLGYNMEGQMEDPIRVAYLICSLLGVPLEARQHLLSLNSASDRLETILEWLPEPGDVGAEAGSLDEEE